MDFNENAWIRSNHNYLIFYKKLYNNIFNIRIQL